MPFTLLSGLPRDQQHAPSSSAIDVFEPLRYAINIAHRVYLEGAGVGLLIEELWPLAAIALITLSVSAWLFRHRLT